MKISILLYVMGLLLLLISLYLLVYYHDSNRMMMISGGLAFLGLPLNIGGFVMKKVKQ